VAIETMSELMEQRAPDDPATVFLEMPGDHGERLTYGDVQERTAQLANALHTLGLRAGDRIAMQVEKSALAVLLYLACLRAGAVLVPMNPGYTDAEVDYLVGDAEPTVFVRDPARTEGSPRYRAGDRVVRVLTADADGNGTLADLAAAEPDSHSDIAVGPDDLAAILYTSGTTGRPKGAMLTHQNLAANALTLHELWGFGPDDVLLHALPVFHVHGLFVAINCVLANGTGMVFLPRFDAAEVVDQLGRCTVLMGVPTYYTRLLAEPGFDAAACRNMRLFVSGSAPLLASTHREFEERTGHAILERYGMTETGMLASNPLDGPRRAGTVGPPLPDVEIRIQGSADAPGGIEVRGPNVFGGYWRRPELSATEFTDDGFFRTGDVGSFDEDGYLTIAARAKDVIISGGLNVYPKEVEDVLDQTEGVQESAVVGVPDEDFGEAVVAVVVRSPDADVEVEESALRDAARTRLAAYKVPKRVVFVDALPRNSMGKVEKARLRATLS
jgi:malonyl-CoA/methylmalonyl-CoA synthetase